MDLIKTDLGAAEEVEVGEVEEEEGMQVCGFLQVLLFPPPLKLTARYN
jgi:hypothetical protein